MVGNSLERPFQHRQVCTISTLYELVMPFWSWHVRLGNVQIRDFKGYFSHCTLLLFYIIFRSSIWFKNELNHLYKIRIFHARAKEKGIGKRRRKRGNSSRSIKKVCVFAKDILLPGMWGSHNAGIILTCAKHINLSFDSS